MRLLALCVAAAALCGAAEVSLERAPARVKAAVNPYQASAEAAAAGAKLYRRNCAACHGAQRQGAGHAPALPAARIESAPPGALFWVITNGILPHGMPAWSSLPPQQRWQIVTFLQAKREGQATGLSH